MKAYNKYNLISSRSNSLITLWNELNDNPKNLKEKYGHEDLIRAAIVLKVAAADQYFTNKFMEILIPYIKDKGPTDDLSNIIEESGISFQEALNLLRSDKPFRKIELKVKSKITKYVTQNEKKIDDLFKGFGIPNLCESAQRMSKKDKLLRNINLLIRRRHSIVHDGDIDNKGNVKRIGKAHILKKIKDMDTFVSNCEIILNNLTK